jgi:hypothetical protein
VRSSESRSSIAPTEQRISSLPDGATRTARYLGSKGCVTLPLGQNELNFTPVVVKSRLPWPMGDKLPDELLPEGSDSSRMKAGVDAAFQPPQGLKAHSW